MHTRENGQGMAPGAPSSSFEPMMHNVKRNGIQHCQFQVIVFFAMPATEAIWREGSIERSTEKCLTCTTVHTCDEYLDII